MTNREIPPSSSPLPLVDDQKSGAVGGRRVEKDIRQLRACAKPLAQDMR